MEYTVRSMWQPEAAQTTVTQGAEAEQSGPWAREQAFGM